MDSKLRKILTECIRDIETGARDVEGCLRRHPDRAAELRPHLELWSRLNAASKAQPNLASQQRGQQQLLGALADMERRKRRMIPTLLAPAAAKVAAVMAGVMLLGGGAAGASAALGGPNVPDEILTSVGIRSDHDEGTAEETLETVDENTPVEADFGLDIALVRAANDAAQDGLNTAEDTCDALPHEARHACEDELDVLEDACEGLADEEAQDACEDALDSDRTCQDLTDPAACQAVVATTAGACAEITNEATLSSCKVGVNTAEDACDALPHDPRHACQDELDVLEDAAEDTLDALEDACEELADEEAQDACEDALDSEDEDDGDDALDDDDDGDDLDDDDDSDDVPDSDDHGDDNLDDDDD